MKKIFLTLIAMVTMTISAQAMSFSQAQQEALYLSDKMAFELSLSNAQYEAVYEINLDYMMALTVSNDIYGVHWEHRNKDLSYVLSSYQYRTFLAREYFYRPVYWKSGFVFRIYQHYTNRTYFYYARPSHYTTYRGAHSWHSNGNHSFYKGRTFNRKTNVPKYDSHQNTPKRDNWHGKNENKKPASAKVNTRDNRKAPRPNAAPKKPAPSKKNSAPKARENRR